MLKCRTVARWAIPAVLPLFLSACPPVEQSTRMELPAPATPHQGVSLDLQSIARGLDRPLFLTSSRDADTLYVALQGGQIRLIVDGELAETPFLDLTEILGATSEGGGLIGLALHPQFDANGVFFVHYVPESGDSVIARYNRSEEDPGVADPGSASIVLEVDQPDGLHKGGMLTFGPDGYLYIGIGDGGIDNDPAGNGQALDTLLGKVLRINVDIASPYTIPVSNPFVGNGSALPEIWAYGLRNPWRFSFDRRTNELWLPDVGQETFEEINVQSSSSTGGENYGWAVREGDDVRPGAEDLEIEGAKDPLLAYFTQGRHSVIGGYVYRGAAIPALRGAYLFADFMGNSVYSLTRSAGVVNVINETANLNSEETTLAAITSFGEDSRGELYILDYANGGVHKIVPTAVDAR